MSAIFLLFALRLSVANRTVSCSLDSQGEVRVTEGFDAAADAWATFLDTYSRDGWGQIHIWTNPSAPSRSQMYCAGFVDTYATQDQVRANFRNYKAVQTEGKNEWPASWQKFVLQNINYMRTSVMNKRTEYWARMGLIMAQIDGMLAGLNHGASAAERLSEIDFWLLQAAGDLDDLAGILEGSEPRDPELTLKCTGLIKLAPGNEDVYFAQDTWSHYTDLHAYLKEYNLNVPEFKAHRVTVSTRTGHLPSVDDFWTADTGLLVLETTLHNFNNTLYDLYVKPESVLTWIRSYYATFVSDNGREWTEEFIKENSGTYNNEYIVLDSKRFEKGQPPKSDFLWMIEQLPGHYKSQDITEVLKTQTYFGSINTPWFEELFNLADYPGQQVREPAKKDFWSYYNQPRYRIIERDAPGISNYEEFKTFMRYNNYTTDPLLLINGIPEPAQGILSRYDLRPEAGTSYGAKNCFGGLDTKTARLSQFTVDQKWDAILSPEYIFNPPFSFKDWPEVLHEGLEDTWQHDWIEFKPLDYCKIQGKTKSSCLDIPGCGWCFSKSGSCMSGNKTGPDQAMGYKCSDAWKVKTENPSYAKPLVITTCIIVIAFVVVIYISAYRFSKRQSF